MEHVHRIFHDAHPEPDKTPYKEVGSSSCSQTYQTCIADGSVYSITRAKKSIFDLPPYLTLLLRTGRQELKSS